MQEIIINLVVGIVGSLIAAVLYDSLVKPRHGPSKARQTKNTLPPMRAIDVRQEKREIFGNLVFNLFFRAYTFFIVYEAISFPLILKAWLSKERLLLSDAKAIGHLLPSIAINSDIVQLVFFVIAIPAYLLAAFIVSGVTSPIERVIDQYWPITALVRRRIQGILFISVASSFAVSCIWLFYSLTLKDAIFNFWGAILMGGFLLAASGERSSR